MVNKIPFIKSLIGEFKFKFKSCHNLKFSKTKTGALGLLKWATHKNYPHNFYTPKTPSSLLFSFPFLQKKGKRKKIKNRGEAGRNSPPTTHEAAHTATAQARTPRRPHSDVASVVSRRKQGERGSSATASRGPRARFPLYMSTYAAAPRTLASPLPSSPPPLLLSPLLCPFFAF